MQLKRSGLASFLPKAACPDKKGAIRALLNHPIMKKTILFSSLALILFASCKKEISGLPEATQTGANTFGARVNGEMWIPQQFGPFNASNLLEARLLGNNFYLKAQNFASSPNESEFDLAIGGLTGTGTYSLNVNTNYPSQGVNYGYYVKRNLTPINEWITSASNIGSITITRFDTTARIISGTFQFTGGEINNSASAVSVTDGRFDVKY
jgi:hypothetical protein